jgi:hypothetical protein
MARPLIEGEVPSARVSGFSVVVLGLAVGAAGVAPVVGAVLATSALVGAVVARLPRRAVVLHR